jgi:hypothetical protein
MLAVDGGAQQAAVAAPAARGRPFAADAAHADRVPTPGDRLPRSWPRLDAPVLLRAADVSLVEFGTGVLSNDSGSARSRDDDPRDLGWPRSTAAPLASENSRFCPACYRRRRGESGPLVWVCDRPRRCRASGVGKDGRAPPGRHLRGDGLLLLFARLCRRVRATSRALRARAELGLPAGGRAAPSDRLPR